MSKFPWLNIISAGHRDILDPYFNLTVTISTFTFFPNKKNYWGGGAQLLTPRKPRLQTPLWNISHSKLAEYSVYKINIK